MQVPPSLRVETDERAVSLLRRYYAPLPEGSGGYTGGQFDTFDPSGTRTASTNTFTGDDLVSLSLLSERVQGRAALELLVRKRRLFEVLLEDVGPDRDLVDLASVQRSHFGAAWRLWRELDDLPGLGPTRVSKLMARKRPRLFPILDRVVIETLFTGLTDPWQDLWASLRASERHLHKRLVHLRDEAGLDASVSPLRILDVCAWMDYAVGSGG